MLSQGKYHELLPKDLEENLDLRVKILQRAKSDPVIQAGLMEMCRQDCLFFINLFAIQINPKTRDQGPFITWPYQDVAIIGGETEIGGKKVEQYGILQNVDDQKDCRWPKSREGGASWVVLLAITWLCLFHDNILAGAISRDEDSVDKLDDPSSLFEKVRIILKYLPDWMTGGINTKTGVRCKKMNIVFRNANVLTGEANVGSAGVGSRFTVMLVDEFGQFDKNGEEIYNFTSDTCDCRIFVFTHKDQAGMAYQLCYDAKYTHMREIMTHWSQHPAKNRGLYRFDEETGKIDILDKSYDFGDYEFVYETKPLGGPCPGIRSPWYDEQSRRRTERDVAMNLDIDPRGASDQFFDAYRVSLLKAAHCVKPIWTGNLTEQGNLEYAGDGLIKLWVNPRSPTRLPVIRAGAGVDVSAGSGYSPSCLSVFDARTGAKVLEYSNANIYAPDFATFCYNLLSMILDEHGNRPLLAWEIQGSAAFERRLIDELHYSPGYVKREEDALGKPRDNKGRYGFHPTPKSILTLMEQYRDALYDHRCINQSEDAVDETLRFVYTTTSVEYRAKGKRKEDGSGAKIHHGDMVRADALAYKMIKEMGFESPEREIQKAEWLDPRTFEGRTKLAEKRWAEEEEEVWA